MNPVFLKESADGILLAIKLQPRSSANLIAGLHGDELKVKVTAPPVDSAANEELVAFLAKKLGCPRGAVEIARGETSRHKVIRIRQLGADAILKRLST